MNLASSVATHGQHTEEISHAVTEGMASTWFNLRQYRINPILDQRYASHGFDPVDDDSDRRGAPGPTRVSARKSVDQCLNSAPKPKLTGETRV